MNRHFYRLSALSIIAVMTALDPAATIAAKSHNAPVAVQTSLALPVPSGAVTSEPFTWSRSYHIGASMDLCISKSVTGKTYGGRSINKGFTNYLRCKFNALRPGADQNHSDQLQLFLWVAPSRAKLHGEPMMKWVLTDYKGMQGLSSAFGTSLPQIYTLVPSWELYQAGTYQPGRSFIISEPEGLDQTSNTTVTYRGMQMVGKVQCAYFQYRTSIRELSGEAHDEGSQGEIWIDPKDGIYRYLRNRKTYEFTLDGNSGMATETYILGRL